MSKVTRLSAERARSLLEYDETSGTLRWTEARGGRFPGTIAGTIKRNKRGAYITVTIDQCKHYAHRVIWLIKTGCNPEFVIDHKDCCGTNNAWSNLRAATHAQNLMNAKRATRKPRGVFFEKRRSKFLARLAGKHLGYFSTQKEAAEAYTRAAKAAFGEFVRT